MNTVMQYLSGQKWKYFFLEKLKKCILLKSSEIYMMVESSLYGVCYVPTCHTCLSIFSFELLLANYYKNLINFMCSP